MAKLGIEIDFFSQNFYYGVVHYDYLYLIFLNIQIQT